MSLILLLFLANTATASVSLYPDTSREVTICEGATVVLTCVTDTGTLRWSTPAGNKTFNTNDEPSLSIPLGNNISVELTADRNMIDDVLTSELSIIGAPLIFNGSLITCRDDDESSGTVKNITLRILDMLPPPTNLTFTALNFTSAMLSWFTSGNNPNCFYGYDIIIRSNTSMVIHNSTTIATTLNVTGFTRGVEYTVSVYGIDNNGRLGKNGTILMTLDVADEVVLQSKEVNLHVSWKHQLSSRPPVVYYSIHVHASSNSSELNLTTELTNFTIQKAQPGQVYYVEVTPVNELGAGRVRTINISIPTDPLVNACMTTVIVPSTPVYTPESGIQIQLWILVAMVIPWVLLILMVTCNLICCCTLKAKKKGKHADDLKPKSKMKQKSATAAYELSPASSTFYQDVATASNSDPTYQDITTSSQPFYQEVTTSNSAHQNQAALSIADDIAAGNESGEEEGGGGEGGGGEGGGGEGREGGEGEGRGDACIYEDPTTECGNELFCMERNYSYSTIPTQNKK